MGSFDTALLAALVIGIMIVRQSVKRPVTLRDFILPALGAVYLTLRYGGEPMSGTGILIQVCAILGIFSGLVAAGTVRVWRDEETGLVWQHGGWRYALVLGALVALRAVVHQGAVVFGLHAQEAALNDALIAMALGNYLGRTVQVGVRSLQLTGWNVRALPRHRTEARRIDRAQAAQVQAGTASKRRSGR